ncbi:hypothetical protein GOODEAATRI_016802 [Goodea atripinnis]|uniref:5'-nucleotidase, cytosolic IAb n=1 Tax=Goodea atripinnis TaxID=208336 RepID=A0ABV0NXS8_9TELE
MTCLIPATLQPKPENSITIAVSSRVLFNMEKEQQIFEQQGMEEYIKYQVAHETEPFSPGPAFSFVKWISIILYLNTHPGWICSQALEAVNTQLRDLYPESEELFDVVLITNNHAYPSRNITVFPALEKIGRLASQNLQLRVAFDGDAVLFSDESEQIYKAHGLDKFFEHEKAYENKPLDHVKYTKRGIYPCYEPVLVLGPLKGFLEVLGKLQKKFYAKGQRMDCPIRTYLVTARSAASSGARALKTLRSWGLEIDEALFLAGAPKGPILEKIRPHIFFDDQMFHVEGAAEMGTVACHVPYGIAQRVPEGKGIKDKEISSIK